MLEPARLRRQWTWLSLAVLAACPFLVALAARLVHALTYADSDFFTFWLAGYMNWTGQNPYSAEQWLAGHQQFGAAWISDLSYSYPLPLATLLAPIGLLRLDQAYIVWVATSGVLLVVALFALLLRRPEPRLKHYIFPVLAGLVLFRPVWVTLRNGQLGAFLLFALVLAGLLWEEQRWLAGGVVIVLVALKPTVGLPILGLIGVWLLAARRWRALAGLAGGGAALAGLGLVRDPRWVMEFLASGQSKLAATFGYSPTLWGMAGAACGHEINCTLWLGGGLAGAVALGAIACAWRLSPRYSPLASIGLSIVVGLLVTPYLWGYDQVLLLFPILLVMGELIRRGLPFLPSALAFLALDIAAIALLYVALQTGEDVGSALITLLVGAGALALWATRARPAGQPELVAG